MTEIEFKLCDDFVPRNGPYSASFKKFIEGESEMICFSDGRRMLLGSELLYGICNGREAALLRLLEILENAFNAGAAAAKEGIN